MSKVGKNRDHPPDLTKIPEVVQDSSCERQVNASLTMEDNPMKYYVGLDVSNNETSICIVDESGNFVKETKVSTDPEAIHRYLKKTKLSFENIGLEAGSLSHWLVLGLRLKHWTVTCIDSRFMAAILAATVNKTDKNDARSIANAIRCNNYKEVHLKSKESLKINTLLTSRRTLVQEKASIVNVIRGLLKSYGIKMAPKKKSVREAINYAISFDDYSPEDLKLSSSVDWTVIEPLIICVETMAEQIKNLDKKIETMAISDPVVRRLMTHPGVGPITAMTFKAEIDDPSRFKKSRSVGAYFGMTPRQYSSGEIVRQGRVSKQGSTAARTLLHEAGLVLITRTKKKSKLKTWGLKKKRQLKTQKAAMAVGRKIAVNLHKMWIEERDFDPQMNVDDFCPEETLLESEREKKREARLLKEMLKKKPRERKKSKVEV